MRRREISDGEIGAVMAAVRMHPKARRYHVDTKSSDITIYERIGPDRLELAAELGLIRWSVFLLSVSKRKAKAAPANSLP